jgi:hypothetical protein
VALRIERLPLFQGQFLLAVGVCAPDDSELYHLLDNAFEFSVFAPGVGEGLVFVQRSWGVSAAERPEVASEVAG